MSDKHEKFQQSLYLRDQYRMREHERYLKGLKAYQETAQRYYQIMVTIGYLGFLAIWTGVSKDIGVDYRNWSALLMTLSALIFIGYELVASYFASRRVNEVADFVKELDDACSNGDEELYVHLVHVQAITISKREIIEKRTVPAVFLSSSLLGLVSGIVLMIGLFKAEMPQLTHWLLSVWHPIVN